MSEPKLEIRGTAKAGDAVADTLRIDPGVQVFNQLGVDPGRYEPPVWDCDVEWVLTAHPTREMKQEESLIMWRLKTD